ncbi:hypothetical protein LCGC14_0796290 [marine sediment metagenome]|uniref:Uncharacterized protein n=1 Tax=marine sediment metagenome TaxID=412755 RepID=A0A0F9PQW5_9ZZZZ
MTITEFIAAIRVHLGDTATIWSTTEITRAVEHATHDLSRFVPRELIKEYTLDYTEVTDAQVTLSAHGTFKAMANKPIKWGSERIADDASETTVYTKDTDYTIDYSNGEITSISTGSIGATDTIFCNYTVNRHTIDISGLTDLIRVARVEYPLGNVPQHFATFELFGGFLTLTRHPNDPQSEPQHELGDTRHVAVYYNGYHTPSTATAGTAPLFYDEILVKGGEAYSWLIRAAVLEHSAQARFESAVTILGTTINHTAATTALAAGSTAAAAATTTLALIASDNVHAGAETALNKAKTELDLITALSTGNELYDAINVEDCDSQNEGAIFLSTATADAISAESYLTAGDAKINLVNLGDEVARLNLEYANGAGAINDRLRDHVRLHLERGTLHMQTISGYLNEATTRLQKVVMYVQEAQTEVTNANAYARIGEGYEADIANLIQEAGFYIQMGTQELQLAVLYREMGIERRDEFWAILGSRHQLGTDKHSTQRS